MQKTYIVASMIAISTILFAAAISSVKAYGPYNTTFDVMNDPYGVGATNIGGMSPLYGESIYKDVGLTVNKVGANDVRLTPAPDGAGGYYPAGSVVTASDYDLGLTLSTGWLTVKHAENVLVDTFYEYGEFIYKAAGTTVAVGDTRYSNITGYKVGSVVAVGDTDIGTPVTTFKPATAAHLEKWANNFGGASGYDFARLLVDIYWSTDIPNDTPDGMRGYQIHVTVDPNVLTPLDVIGSQSGYVLFEYLASLGSPLGTAIVKNVQPDFIEMTENILGDVPNGAGDAFSGAFVGGFKLVTFAFIPQSEFAYSPITLNPFPASGDYQDAGSLMWHACSSYTQGLYNFVTPEFPLGIGVLMSVVALVPVVYVWRTRKKVIKP